MYDNPEALYQDISKTLKRLSNENAELVRLANRIRDGTAKAADAHRFSVIWGELTSQAARTHVTPANFAEFGWEFSDGAIKPVLLDNFRRVTSNAAAVQKVIDQAEGVGLMPITPETPEGRIGALCHALGDYSNDWQRIITLLDDPLINLVQSFNDDFVEANAKFRSEAGMESRIVRTAEAGACDWCRELEGSYLYPGDVPKNVFRRHDFCRCTVTYQSGRSRYNVWNKKQWLADDDTLSARRLYGLD